MRFGVHGPSFLCAILCAASGCNGQASNSDKRTGTGVAPRAALKSIGTVSTDQCDMSTESRIGEVYKRLTGVSDAKACVTFDAKFPGFAKVGYLVADAGCINQIQIWKCTKAGRGVVPSVLQSVGWTTTDDAGRARIAADWLSFEGLQLVDGAQSVRIVKAARKSIVTPKVTASDGSIQIEGWYSSGYITIAGGHTRYERLVTVFDRKGAITQTTRDAFELDGMGRPPLRP